MFIPSLYFFGGSKQPLFCHGLQCINIIAENHIFNAYSMIIVFPDAIPEQPKIGKVYPIGIFSPYSLKQGNSVPQIVSYMIVIGEHYFAPVIDVYIFVFFVLYYLALCKWDIL